MEFNVGHVTLRKNEFVYVTFENRGKSVTMRINSDGSSQRVRLQARDVITKVSARKRSVKR